MSYIYIYILKIKKIRQDNTSMDAKLIYIMNQTSNLLNIPS